MRKKLQDKLFIFGQDKEYGNMGYKLSNNDSLNFFEGMGVIHDLLEHYDNEFNINAEFRALGALLAIRKDDYFSMKNSYYLAVNNIASDFIQIWHYYINSEYGLTNNNTNQFYDSKIIDIVQEGYRLLNSELKEDFIYNRNFFQTALNELQNGYNTAHKIYKHNIVSGELPYTFYEMEQHVNKLIKYSDYGCSLRIKFYDNNDYKISLYDENNQLEESFQNY